jgi:glucose/arabinose dehydrogenase
MTGTIFLEDSELGVGELAGVVRVPIVRTGDTSGAVTVEYGITGNTAVAGKDFIGGNGTVTIPAGQTRITIDVPIQDDQISEATETFTVALINVDSGSLLAPRTAQVSILDNENPVVDPPTPPLTSEYDVGQTDVITSLSAPIDFAFAPADPSRMYIAEKGGVVKVADVQSGQVLSTFMDISAQVNDRQDRGLLDIELDPNFPDSPYIYAFYVVDPPETQGQSGNAGPNGGGNRFAYVSRFEADAANDYLTVVPGSETVLVGGAGQSLADISGNGAVDSTSDRNQAESGVDPVTGEYIDDYIKLDSRSHAGGALAFGEDGALYVSTGDGTSFNYADPRTVSVQDINSLSGKVLRIDPATGDGLADNPFVQPGDDLSDNSSKVYQLGLRNPFSMGFDADGQLFVTDTGWRDWEEINVGEAGANFGWPFYEGGDNGVLVQERDYKNLPEAQAFYDAVAAGDVTVTPAFRAFSHKSNDPGFQVQAIIGGNTIYDGDAYPASLKGNYLFSDFSQGEVFAVDTDNPRDVDFLFKSDSGRAPVHFGQGPDGLIYYADIVTGKIGTLDISGGPATEYQDDPNVTQYIQGATGPDRFVIDGNSSDYVWEVTDARDGHVVWTDDGFDLLYGFEQVAFNDRTIDLPPTGSDGPVTVNDDPATTQYLTGSDQAGDTFVIAGNASDYGWGATDDGTGTVVWSGNAFDVLTGFETLQFNDISVDITTPDPNQPLTVEDIPNVTQFLTGTDGIDTFVVDGNAADYGLGPTEDNGGVVIWTGASFDILEDFERVQFNDTTVSIDGFV